MTAVSERPVCRVLGLQRSIQRKMPGGTDDEAVLTEKIIALARLQGLYGYRRVTALLRDAGWHVNRKRVERIWRREGLNLTDDFSDNIAAYLEPFDGNIELVSIENPPLNSSRLPGLPARR